MFELYVLPKKFLARHFFSCTFLCFRINKLTTDAQINGQTKRNRTYNISVDIITMHKQTYSYRFRVRTKSRTFLTTILVLLVLLHVDLYFILAVELSYKIITSKKMKYFRSVRSVRNWKWIIFVFCYCYLVGKTISTYGGVICEKIGKKRFVKTSINAPCATWKVLFEKNKNTKSSRRFGFISCKTQVFKWYCRSRRKLE